MSVAVYSQQLSSYGADRAAGHVKAGLVSEVYVKAWPVDAAVWSNEGEAPLFRERDVPLWLWFVCGSDQALAAKAVASAQGGPFVGILLDIEKGSEGQKLDVVLDAAIGTGLPVRASLGSYHSASYANLDFRGLDRRGIPVEWQSYFDSGEGAPPAEAVAELYRSSFVIPGWEYRHRWGTRYGWGKAVDLGRFDSYLQPGTPNASFFCKPRVVDGVAWGLTVDTGLLTSTSTGQPAGQLLGRAAYTRIRVALDTTRGANDARTLDEWTAVAASARVPGSAKRPVSVYLAETTSDEVLEAIVAGAP